jgi:protocatechuate 3,4-dioxygenase beta subunit
MPPEKFELRTIHPGCYPGMRVPAHIHFVLWGGGHPLQWTEELKFEGGRYITAALLAADAQLGDFRTIRSLSRGNGGVLRCGFRIRLQRETNFHQRAQRIMLLIRRSACDSPTV